MDRLRSLIRPLGYLVTILSVIYLANIVAHFNWNALVFRNPLKSLAYIVLFSLWASLFVFICAYNWKLILNFLSGSSVSTKDVFQVYLKSNVAKYLPGNVMHYAGRNYLGKKLGWKNSEMAFSSLLEFISGALFTGMVIITMIATGFIKLPQQLSLKLSYPDIFRSSAIAAACGLFMIILIYSYRFFFSKEQLHVTTQKLRHRARQFFTGAFILLSIKLFLISLFCFFLNSIFFFFLCRLILDFRIEPFDIFSVYSALGIANYSAVVTPGVPSGLGVKESVSFLLISAYGYPKEILMVSILLYRLVCILGDFIAFLYVILSGDKRTALV